jgi:hypothetical protein
MLFCLRFQRKFISRLSFGKVAGDWLQVKLTGTIMWVRLQAQRVNEFLGPCRNGFTYRHVYISIYPILTMNTVIVLFIVPFQDNIRRCSTRYAWHQRLQVGRGVYEKRLV